MAQEVPADALGDEFKGYVLRITGGNDVRFASLLCAPLIVVSNKILTMLLIRMFNFNSSIRLDKITKFDNSLLSLSPTTLLSPPSLSSSPVNRSKVSLSSKVSWFPTESSSSSPRVTLATDPAEPVNASASPFAVALSVPTFARSTSSLSSRESPTSPVLPMKSSPSDLVPRGRPRSVASSTSTSLMTFASSLSVVRSSPRRKEPSPTLRRELSQSLIFRIFEN